MCIFAPNTTYISHISNILYVYIYIYIYIYIHSFFIFFFFCNIQRCIKTLYIHTKNPKVKNSPLEFEKDFKPINISVDDMNKLEKKRTNNKDVWHHWYDRLINYIPDLLKKYCMVLRKH